VCELEGRRIITLLTDFGTEDMYVPVMKGVILTLNPNVEIIDLSHDVPKFNVQHAAFLLAQAVSYFPEGTVHVAVVDPSVGTTRRPIIVKTKRSLLVGPDNGILYLAVRKEGFESAVTIENESYMLPGRSKTFDGRDVFSPASAYLTMGKALESFGLNIKEIEKPPFTQPIVSGKNLVCEVLYIDGFGNVVTNAEGNLIQKIGLKEKSSIKMKTRRKTLRLKFHLTYGDADRGSFLALVGSHGFFEVAVNQGNAADKLKVKVGERISFSLK